MDPGAPQVLLNLFFEFQGILKGQNALVHANILNFYAKSELDVTEELLDAATNNDSRLYPVTKLLDLRFNPFLERLEAQVEWCNFSGGEPP